jgi:hypothetical protein
MNSLLRSVAAAAALLTAGSSLAQFREIAFGDLKIDRLQATDARLSERGRFHAYALQLEQGQRLLATLESKEFDAYLVFGRLVNGIFDPIRTDDDSGGNTNARLRVQAPEAGQYIILAQALGADGLGTYALRVIEAPPPTTGGVRPISIGQTIEGELADTDIVNDERGSYVDFYRVTASAGQRLQITLRSERFDALLSLGIGDDTNYIERESNDDAGGSLGRDSRIRYRVTESGDLMIRAGALSGNGVGTYTLTVEEMVTRPPQPPQPIESGAEIASELTDSDSEDENGKFYHAYVIRLAAGQTLVARQRSSNFDSFLAVGRMSGGSFTPLATNDDGGNDGVNSLLEFRAPAAGEYILRATTLGTGATGAYTLRVDVND